MAERTGLLIQQRNLIVGSNPSSLSMSYISGLIEAELIIKKEKEKHEKKNNRYKEIAFRNETSKRPYNRGNKRNVPKS